MEPFQPVGISKHCYMLTAILTEVLRGSHDRLNNAAWTGVQVAAASFQADDEKARRGWQSGGHARAVGPWCAFLPCALLTRVTLRQNPSELNLRHPIHLPTTSSSLILLLEFSRVNFPHFLT